MTNDDQPGIWGLHLLGGALEANQRRPDLNDQLATTLQRLVARIEAREAITALDPDVQELCDLIEAAGVPRPPLLDRKPT